MVETEVKTAKNNENVEYINEKELKDKKTVYSVARFNRIKKSDGKELSLKIGRYKKSGFHDSLYKMGVLECKDPKSELTLDQEEIDNLVDYINKNYQPLTNNETNYLSLSDESMSNIIKEQPETILDFVRVAIENNFDVSDANKMIEFANRKKSLEDFKINMRNNVIESTWQKWFEDNPWVLGADFLKITEDRRIDVTNISDFLARHLDGYIDVIEIKRPSDSQQFFDSSKDHDNYVPHASLTKAITQLVNYLHSLEKKSNELDTTKRLGKILKPRGILIYGRSKEWDDDRWESFRLLNDTLNNITIYTYDMIFERAVKMSDYLSNKADA